MLALTLLFQIVESSGPSRLARFGNKIRVFSNRPVDLLAYDKLRGQPDKELNSSELSMAREMEPVSFKIAHKMQQVGEMNDKSCLLRAVPNS